MVGRQNWRASRFGQRSAVEQPQPVGKFPNRDLALAAVPDPYGLDRRPVRVTVSLDVLDRLLKARRIGPGAHAAGRAYQRLLEIASGGSALEAGGVRNATGDDLVVRAIVKAEMVSHELTLIHQIIGQRSERLLHAVLIERRTLANLAGAGKHRVFALSQRLVDSLEDLAAYWHAVQLE